MCMGIYICADINTGTHALNYSLLYTKRRTVSKKEKLRRESRLMKQLKGGRCGGGGGRRGLTHSWQGHSGACDRRLKVFCRAVRPCWFCHEKDVLSIQKNKTRKSIIGKSIAAGVDLRYTLVLTAPNFEPFFVLKPLAWQDLPQAQFGTSRVWHKQDTLLTQVSKQELRNSAPLSVPLMAAQGGRRGRGTGKGWEE